MERPGGPWRQTQLPFAAVRRQQGRSPDFGAAAAGQDTSEDEVEGEVLFPSDSGSSAQSSQVSVLVPGTPPTPPESPYRHDSQAAQRGPQREQQPSTPPLPRQLMPEQIAYLQAQEQERFQRQRQAELEQRSFQAGLRSDRAFYQGEFPITRTAPGPNPNEPDYSISGQTDDRYPWQLYTGRTQQQQQDLARAAAINAAPTHARTNSILASRRTMATGTTSKATTSGHGPTFFSGRIKIWTCILRRRFPSHAHCTRSKS